jgi:type VI protein secretion system component Hcp
MAKRRRWDEELEEREGSLKQKPKLAQLDEGTRAGVLEGLQRAGGNRAFQQVLGGQALQRQVPAVRLPAAAGVRGSMRIAEIPGPLKTPGQAGAHEVVSLDYDVHTPTVEDLRGHQKPGRTKFSLVKVAIRKSTTTNKFKQFLIGEEPIPTVEITSALEDGIEVLKLSGVRVMSVSEGSTGAAGTIVKVELDYEEIELVTKDSAGKVVHTMKLYKPRSPAN